MCLEKKNVIEKKRNEKKKPYVMINGHHMINYWGKRTRNTNGTYQGSKPCPTPLERRIFIFIF